MWKIVNGDYEVSLIRRHIPFSEILKCKKKGWEGLKILSSLIPVNQVLLHNLQLQSSVTGGGMNQKQADLTTSSP